MKRAFLDSSCRERIEFVDGERKYAPLERRFRRLWGKSLPHLLSLSESKSRFRCLWGKPWGRDSIRSKVLGGRGEGVPGEGRGNLSPERFPLPSLDSSSPQIPQMKKARIAPGLFHERRNMFVYGVAPQQNCCGPYTGMLYIYDETFPRGKRVERKALTPAFQRARAKIYGAGDGI